MKLRGKALALCCVPFWIGCGDLAKKASEAQDQLTALKAEYDSFDLSCNFDEISGSTEAESDLADTADSALQDPQSSTTESNTCENAAEQYSLLVDKFDADQDGKLSTAELATAEAGWAEAQKAQLDSDGDGSVSDQEKTEFKSNNFAERKEKLVQAFEKNCLDNGKDLDSCRDRRKEHANKKKDEILSKFDKDKNGKLSPDEIKEMVSILKQEREQAKADIFKQRDKNGDGKLSPDELKAKLPKDGGAPAPDAGAPAPAGGPQPNPAPGP